VGAVDGGVESTRVLTTPTRRTLLGFWSVFDPNALNDRMGCCTVLGMAIVVCVVGCRGSLMSLSV
jgi:hypothetical protein